MNAIDPIAALQPPHSVEAEMALIGSVLLDPTVLGDIAPILGDSGVFWAEAHGTIYRAIQRCLHAHKTIDLVMLRETLGDSIDDIGGATYLTKLATETPGPATAIYHARIVADHARRRKLIDTANRIVYRAHNSTDPVDSILTASLTDMTAICRVSSSTNTTLLHRAAESVRERILSGEPDMTPTGLDIFDRTLGGFPKGDVTSIYGYPASGKTTFALQIAFNQAMLGQQVRVYSYEQNRLRIAATLLSSASGVGVHGLLNTGRQPSVNEMSRLDQTISDFTGVPFEIADRSVDAPTIYAECVAAHAKHGPGTVLIDYLQILPSFGKFFDETPRINESMRVIAAISRDLGWTTLVVSQLDKSAAKENRPPRIADAKGSQAVEAQSGYIVSVWRPFQQERQNDESGGDLTWEMRQRCVEWTVLKSKYSSLGKVTAAFDGATMTYRDRTMEENVAWSG